MADLFSLAIKYKIAVSYQERVSVSYKDKNSRSSTDCTTSVQCYLKIC